VVSSGPADKAGLESGDVITEFDGAVVITSEELVAGIRDHEPGDTVTVVYVRGEESLVSTEITLGQRPTS